MEYFLSEGPKLFLLSPLPSDTGFYLSSFITKFFLNAMTLCGRAAFCKCLESLAAESCSENFLEWLLLARSISSTYRDIFTIWFSTATREGITQVCEGFCVIMILRPL